MSISFSVTISLFLVPVWGWEDVRIVLDSEFIFIGFLVHYGNGALKHVLVLDRVHTGQGKVGEKNNFSMSGNLEFRH